MKKLINWFKNKRIKMIFTATPLTQNGYYKGEKTRLGTNSRHWSKRPSNIKKPVIAFIGASVPKQIADKVISLNTTNVRILNMCVPAQDINVWKDPNSNVWSNALNVLKANNLTWEDVNVVWTMQDDLRDGGDQRFPEAPETLKASLNELYFTLQLKFPNLRQLDLASRTYSFSEDSKHGEPSCYHTGWANAWFVRDHRKDYIYCTDKCYMWNLDTPITHYVDDLIHYSAEGQNFWGAFVYNYYKNNFEWFS